MARDGAWAFDLLAQNGRDLRFPYEDCKRRLRENMVRTFAAMEKGS